MSLFLDIQKSLSNFKLDMQISAGSETLALLGESGCGKSMTLKCIAGVETPDSGKIVVNNVVFFDKSSTKHARINLSPQRRKTALLFQNYMLFPNLTVSQNVSAGIDSSIPSDRRDEIIKAQLAKFSIEQYADAYPGQLSGGQQQRVALARMLSADPKILMLDEPLSALDSHLKGVLEQRLSFMFDDYENTILYVSHDIDEAMRLCDRIAVVDHGQICEECSSQELVNKPTSLAGLKLSGCKNIAIATKVSDNVVHLNNWNIDVTCNGPISDDVKYFGVRAFHLELVREPGLNCYKMKVVHATESRFERAYVLQFAENGCDSESFVNESSDYFEHYLYWRLSILDNEKCEIPKVGDEIYIRIPARYVYLINK